MSPEHKTGNMPRRAVASSLHGATRALRGDRAIAAGQAIAIVLLHHTGGLSSKGRRVLQGASTFLLLELVTDATSPSQGGLFLPRTQVNLVWALSTRCRHVIEQGRGAHDGTDLSSQIHSDIMLRSLDLFAARIDSKGCLFFVFECENLWQSYQEQRRQCQSHEIQSSLCVQPEPIQRFRSSGRNDVSGVDVVFVDELMPISA